MGGFVDIPPYFSHLSARGGLVRVVDGGCANAGGQAEINVSWMGSDATALPDGSLTVDAPIHNDDPFILPTLSINTLDPTLPSAFRGRHIHLTLTRDGKLDATINLVPFDPSGRKDAGTADASTPMIDAGTAEFVLILSGRTSIVCEYAGQTGATFHVASGPPLAFPCRTEPWPDCNDTPVIHVGN